MKRLAEQTLYELLEVPPDAPPDDLRAAIERARTIFGPGSLATYTLMSPDEAELMNRRIAEAGETLLDPEARARYDARLSSVPPEPPLPTPAPTPAPLAARGWGALPPIIPARMPGPSAPARPNGHGGEPTVPAEPVARTAGVVPPEDDLDLHEAGPDADEADEVDEVELAPPSAAPAPERPEPRAAAVEAPPVVAAPPPEPPAAPPPRPLALVTPAPSAPPAEALPAAAAPPRAATPIRLDRPVAPPQAAVTPLPVRGDAAESPSPTFGEGTPWTGEMLRKVREARGLPIQVIAERTKVTRHHLENIEADRFGLLPAPVYLRGILFGLARELRLDGQKVARSYLERMTAALAPPPSPGPKR